MEKERFARQTAVVNPPKTPTCKVKSRPFHRGGGRIDVLGDRCGRDRPGPKPEAGSTRRRICQGLTPCSFW